MDFLYLWGLVACGTIAGRSLYLSIFTSRIRDVVTDPDPKPLKKTGTVWMVFII